MLPQDYRDGRVCIIGLGYVGLTLSVAMADAGFKVTGVERLPEVLSQLRNGQPHFSEVGLAEKLKRQMERGRLVLRERIDEDARAPVYIVTVGTPIDGEKRTQLAAIKEVASKLARILEPGDMVILRSTVRVGVSREVVKPILDGAGVLYNLAFCPERTLEGRALEELRTLPQIVGGVDETSALRAARLFNFLVPTIVRVANAETAELIKLINNTFRDLVFAFANEMATVADAVGVSITDVVHGCGLGYPRGQLPMPGPVGGPCLEKDAHILVESVAHRGLTLSLTTEGRRLNEELPARVVADLARTYAGSGVRRIAVLGLAFKGRPETSDLRGTLAIPLIAQLRKGFPEAEIVGFDPVVPPDDISGLGIDVAGSVEDAFNGADLVVIQNNHPLFATMNLDVLADRLELSSLIYDLWNQHDARRLMLREDVTYAGLGTLLTSGTAGASKTSRPVARPSVRVLELGPAAQYEAAE